MNIGAGATEKATFVQSELPNVVTLLTENERDALTFGQRKNPSVNLERRLAANGQLPRGGFHTGSGRLFWDQNE